MADENTEDKTESQSPEKGPEVTPAAPPPPADSAPQAPVERPVDKKKAEAPRKPPRIVIWAWPKTIVFWPTCVFAILFGFLSLPGGPERDIAKIRDTVKVYFAQDGKPAEKAFSDADAVKKDMTAIDATAGDINLGKGKWFGVIFLAIFTFNLIAFSFDIRVKGLAILILAVCVLIFGSIVFSANFNVLAFMGRLVNAITPVATASFYFTVGLVTLVILLIAMVQTYLHRVVVTNNRIRIRTGLLEADKIYSNQGLSFNKYIMDLMEHWCLFFGMFSKKCGCGRLIFTHSDLDEPIVLDNVIGVEDKAERIGRILSVLAVQERT